MEVVEDEDEDEAEDTTYDFLFLSLLLLLPDSTLAASHEFLLLMLRIWRIGCQMAGDRDLLLLQNCGSMLMLKLHLSLLHGTTYSMTI